MFQGETAITIDDKGRLAIPTSYRDVVARECGNRLVFTYNPFEAGCLYLYPQAVWERVRDQVNALPRTRQVNRQMQLKLVGAACFVEPDGNGRISIPTALRWLAGRPIRPLPSGSTNAAAPTSFSCSSRLFFLVRGSALTWSRTRAQTGSG